MSRWAAADTDPSSPELTTSSTADQAPSSTEPSRETTLPEPGSGARLEPGEHEFALEHDGIDRRYFVHVPPGLAPGPTPVMIALHGGGGTAPQLKSDIGLDAIADREGFLAVYPDGTGPFPELLHTWNGGFNCCGTAQRRGVDDVGFIRAVVADLEARLIIDLGRVAVTGHRQSWARTTQ